MGSTVAVSLGSRSYPVLVEPGCMRRCGIAIRELVHPTRAVVIGGSGIVRGYAETVRDTLEAAGVTAGLLTFSGIERHKTLARAGALLRGLAAAGVDRSGVVVAVGGGVVCDTAGFVAATYMRGIAFVSIPTTLLAQADAGIGGKTGVNLPEGKNLVGVFHQPAAVFMDPSCLRTLSDRDFRSGLAEVIKHGLIRDHELTVRLYDAMEALLRRDMEVLTEILLRSCRVKADVVSRDEREGHLRAALNFGHTIGHAIEKVAGYGSLTHGEAVSIGMTAACLLGEEIGFHGSDLTVRVIDLLTRAGLPTRLPEDLDHDAVLEAMKLDKKIHDGTCRFVLLRMLGDAVTGVQVAPDATLRALARLRSG